MCRCEIRLNRAREAYPPATYRRPSAKMDCLCAYMMGALCPVDCNSISSRSESDKDCVVMWPMYLLALRAITAMSWRHYLRYCSMHTCIQSHSRSSDAGWPLWQLLYPVARCSPPVHTCVAYLHVQDQVWTIISSWRPPIVLRRKASEDGCYI